MPDSIKTTRIALVVAAGLAFATAALFALHLPLRGRPRRLGDGAAGPARQRPARGDRHPARRRLRRLRRRRSRHRRGDRQGPALGPVRRHRHGRRPARRHPRRHGPRDHRPRRVCWAGTPATGSAARPSPARRRAFRRPTV
ncbi:MAG: hypothetical protein MZW92_09890 [Comamonadaceae bacterium]|nr:hypothetical protein [Comamonadaceae bacterium]